MGTHVSAACQVLMPHMLAAGESAVEAGDTALVEHLLDFDFTEDLAPGNAASMFAFAVRVRFLLRCLLRSSFGLTMNEYGQRLDESPTKSLKLLLRISTSVEEASFAKRIEESGALVSVRGCGRCWVDLSIVFYGDVGCAGT